MKLVDDRGILDTGRCYDLDAPGHVAIGNREYSVVDVPYPEDASVSIPAYFSGDVDAICREIVERYFLKSVLSVMGNILCGREDRDGRAYEQALTDVTEARVNDTVFARYAGELGYLDGYSRASYELLLEERGEER